MEIKKNDFVEIEFIAKTKDNGEVFDTNIKKEAENANLNIKEVAPLIISVGRGMTLKGIDSSLEGKNLGESYQITLSPEDSFGVRNSSLVKMIPLKVFLQQKINPEKGMQLSLDGMVVKILSNSGGRVLVDFNHPLAGKEVIYEIKVVRAVEDLSEKINSLQDFFLRRRFEFSLDETKTKITIKAPKSVHKFLSFFGKNFEEILGLKVAFEDKPINSDLDKQ